jgi:shikimate kinase
VGKSTFGRELARELGWNHLSTDQLARHPGRPWRHDHTAILDDVIAHYSSLTAAELVDSVMQHYQQNVWPVVDAIARSHVNNSYDPCLVFEGSAILPELAVATHFERVGCIWLTASDELITQRIMESSQFESRADDEKQLVDAFVERTLSFNEDIVKSVHHLGLQSLDVSLLDAFDQLVLACS